MQKDLIKPKYKNLEKIIKSTVFLLLFTLCIMYVNNTFKNYIGLDTLKYTANNGNLVILSDNFERKFLEKFVKIYSTESFSTEGGFFPSVEDTDKESIIQSLKESSIGVMLPGYIPEGYMLDKSNISYYINANNINKTNDLQTGKTDSMQDFKIYPLNDTYKSNVSGYYFRYKNNKDDYIIIFCSLYKSNNTNTNQYDDISDLEKAVKNPLLDNYKFNIKAENNKVFALNAVKTIDEIDYSSVSKYFGSSNVFLNEIPYKFDTMILNLYSSNLSEEEGLKLLEGLSENAEDLDKI